MEDFFKEDNTEQIIEQTFVKDEDIDNEKYVEGSQGQVKTLKIIDEDALDRIGGKFVFDQKVYRFFYSDEDFPSKPTGIERKNVRKEVNSR